LGVEVIAPGPAVVAIPEGVVEAGNPNLGVVDNVSVDFDSSSVL